MAYTKNNFTNGSVLNASQLNRMDEQIYKNETSIDEVKTSMTGYATKEYVNNAIANIDIDTDVEINLYDSTLNTIKQHYDTNGEIVIDEQFGWYITSDMDISNYSMVTYGGLDKTADANSARSVFKNASGDVINIFLPSRGENILTVPNGAVFVAFTLQMNDIETFYVKAKAKTEPNVGLADNIVGGWYDIIGERLNGLLNKATEKKICCIVDDDTTSVAAVRRLQTACDAAGIKATMACLTTNLDTWKDASPNLTDTLKEMEQDGFQVVLHSHTQSGHEHDFWRNPTAYPAECEADMVQGLQKMHEAGFSNYKYWVTPYCKDDATVQRIARKWGMECLLAGGNTYEPANDTYGRYAIRRAAFGPSDDKNDSSITLAQLQAIAQEAARHNGWLVVMTHFEKWADENEYTETNLRPEPDSAGWIKGRVVYYDNGGEETDGSAYSVTDFIDISGYDSVYVSTKIANRAGICLYNAKHELIKGYNDATGKYNVALTLNLHDEELAGAKYLRVSCWMQDGVFSTSNVEITGKKTVTEAYKRFTDLIDYLKNLGFEFMTVGEAWSYRKPIYDIYDAL